MLKTNTFDAMLANAEASLSHVEDNEIKRIQSLTRITCAEIKNAMQEILSAKHNFDNLVESVHKTYFSSWKSTLKDMKTLYNMDVDDEIKSFKEDKRISRERIKTIRKQHTIKIFTTFKYFCSLYIGNAKVFGFKELLTNIFHTGGISLNKIECVLFYLKNYLQNVKTENNIIPIKDDLEVNLTIA